MTWIDSTVIFEKLIDSVIPARPKSPLLQGPYSTRSLKRTWSSLSEEIKQPHFVTFV